MPVEATAQELARQVHLLRRRVRLLVAAVIVTASLLLMGAAFQSPIRLPGLRTVEAREFVLRDADGQVRARLQVTASGPALVFFDEAGNQTVMIPQKHGVKPVSPR